MVDEEEKKIANRIMRNKISVIRRHLSQTGRKRWLKGNVYATINEEPQGAIPVPVVAQTQQRPQEIVVKQDPNAGIEIQKALLKLLEKMEERQDKKREKDRVLLEEMEAREDRLFDELNDAMRKRRHDSDYDSEPRSRKKSAGVVKGRKSKVKIGESSEGIKVLTLEEMAELDLDEKFEEIEMRKEAETRQLRAVNQTYPLMQSPINETKTIVWANVVYDQNKHSLVYNVMEPPISPEEKQVLDEIKKKLEERLDVEFGGGGTFQQDFLVKKIYEFLDYFGYVLSPDQLEKIIYYITRDFIGLDNLEPIMHDPAIEDISCDGFGIPIFIAHNNPLYGEIETNIVFPTKDDLDNFVMKLAQRAGRAISVASPLLDGALPDGSRVQATFGSDISKRGSNFTIRKFSKEPVTPVKLMKYGTMSAEVLAYLWLCVEGARSMLVSGATATGKTTVLNAISLFIKPEQKIVSIEDTAELRLPHPNWLPQVARAGMGKDDVGGVTMFDLLKAALRQRPDYIIAGEVRGQEAAIMFQAMATGHAGLGTIHAENIEKLINRLTTDPINLSPSLLDSLDLIVFLVRTKLGKHFVRRVNQIVEIDGVDVESNTVVPRYIFEWDPTEDNIASIEPSPLLEKVRIMRGISKEELLSELYRRTKLMEWLVDNNVDTFEDFSKYVETYYVDLLKLREWTGGAV